MRTGRRSRSRSWPPGCFSSRFPTPRAGPGLAGAVHGAAIAAFWLGEAVIFAVPAALVLGTRELTEAQAAWLAVALATATYLVKYLYSPSFFGFPDEFLHLRTLTNLLASHHLLGVNHALPVSPRYPGLEIVTSGLMDLTGLGVFPAGLIVAGLAHLVFTAALYTLFRLVGGTSRIGLAAITIYAANPHYQIFDSIFGYQTLALTFFALALLAVYKATRPGTSRPRVIIFWVLAAVFAAATTVTHHITSYALVGTAVLIAAAGLLARGRKGLAAPACFAAGTAALVALWTWRFSPGTVNYLSPAMGQLTDGIRSAVGGQAAKAAGTALPGPPGDKVASYALALLVMAVIPFGWRQVWRTQRDNAWALALAGGAATYYPCVALPLVTADGSEIAGRLLTFVYIPVGYTIAVALTARPLTPLRRAGAAAGAVVLLAGGISNGLAALVGTAAWPLRGGRVRERHHRRVGHRRQLGRRRAAAGAADRRGLHQQPALRDHREPGPGQRRSGALLRRRLVADRRGVRPAAGHQLPGGGPAHQQVPATERHRLPASGECPAPLAGADLAKFDAVRGITRVYDSGNIIVYRLSEAGYAP